MDIDKTVFKFSDYVMECCKDYHVKNGYKQPFLWEDIFKRFEIMTGKTVAKGSLKNKVEHMKKQWRQWSALKNNVTGVGRDPVTGKDRKRSVLHVRQGYPDRKGYMVLYSKTKYHQSHFVRRIPENYKEAFNRVHSSLRTTIERCLGILEKRGQILKGMPSFDFETQVDIIFACFAL